MPEFSSDLLRSAIDINETIVFEYDVDRDFISFSDNIDNYIPIPCNVSMFVGNIDIKGKIHDEDVKKAISFFSNIPQHGKVKTEYIRFLNFKGDYQWYQLKGRVKESKNDAENVIYGTMTYMDDDTKRHYEENGINKDALTQLCTREFFEKCVNEYLDNISADAIPNLMLVDIDDFEEFKNLNGDIGADGLLIDVSKLLKKTFRGSDIIGRVGVDRFAVFMKGVRNTNILEERATYIKQSIKDMSKDLKELVTVSIGITVMNKATSNPKELIEKALVALLDAKNSGKDNYVLYNENMERMKNLENPILTTKEMQLVRNIVDAMYSMAYVVDENYRILYTNEMLNERIQHENGDLCYARFKGYDSPCSDCPLKNMSNHESSYDCEIYSTSLRTLVPTRVNRISLRNGKSIYLITSIKENLEKQSEEINESKLRVQQAVISMQSLIWDVDIEKNSCIRIREENIMSIMDKRIKNYQMLRDYFAENVIHTEDRRTFIEATDPKYIRQAKHMGSALLCRDVRLKNLQGEYEWFNIYTIIQNTDELKVLIICLNVDEYIHHRLEDIETKVKYEIMKQKSDVLKEIALSNERHEQVNEMTGILVYEYQVASDSYYLSPMFEDVFRINKEKLNGAWALMGMMKPYEDDELDFESFVKEAENAKQTIKTTVRLYNRNDIAVWYTIIIQPLHGLKNMAVRYLVTFQNVDAEMKIKMEMEYRADYDSITGLYNSETFYKKAANYIHLNEEQKMAIISVDIDKFRMINDRYGIDAGNKCLTVLGKHLREMLSRDFLAKRYQGDMFSVLLKYDEDPELLRFMEQLTQRMRDDKELPTPVSLVYGIYKVVEPDIPVRLMCDRARAVKKQLKGSALSNYAVYDDVIRLKLREQTEIESEMEQALINHEFVMYLQPQIDIKTEKICGAEALVRWKHPTKGVMVPGHFLQLFENNGFITKLDIYMWEEACKYIKNLQDRGIMLPISVNVSRLHVGKTDIVDKLTEIVNKYGFDNRYLEIEITENLFIEDVSELFDDMEELKNRGFKIHMDDFGSGYSSLNMLRKAPIDTMKIDRFFLDEIMSTERGKIIVESSVRMAKMIGLKVIAEGVETKEQLDFLAGINCDIAQGYYYSKPIPVEEFEEFVKKYS